MQTGLEPCTHVGAVTQRRSAQSHEERESCTKKLSDARSDLGREVKRCLHEEVVPKLRLELSMEKEVCVWVLGLNEGGE